jgi:IS5 family transposase
MRGQAGFFEIDERLKEISAKGDDLERLNMIVDFEVFRPDLSKAVPRSDGSKGGRPPFDHVFMWKVLIPRVKPEGRLCRRATRCRTSEPSS